MKTIDRFLGSLVFGFIIPITTLCIFWWGSYLLKLDVSAGAPIGLVTGGIIDILLLRKLVNRMYSLSSTVLVVVYVILSIEIFGFFMGVPVFNIIAGVIAAFYIGRKMKITRAKKETFRTKLITTNRFSTLILIIICACSAYIAIRDPYTASNLEGMFNLNFKVTKVMLWGIILIGGAGLVGLQYVASVLVGRLAYSKT